MFLTTWGVKPLKQFYTIILKSMNQNHRSKTPRALNFINRFTLGHQLVHLTQKSCNYNHKGRITIQ